MAPFRAVSRRARLPEPGAQVDRGRAGQHSHERLARTRRPLATTMTPCCTTLRCRAEGRRTWPARRVANPGVRTRQPLSRLLVHVPDDRAEKAVDGTSGPGARGAQRQIARVHCARRRVCRLPDQAQPAETRPAVRQAGAENQGSAGSWRWCSRYRREGRSWRRHRHRGRRRVADRSRARTSLSKPARQRVMPAARTAAT